MIIKVSVLIGSAWLHKNLTGSRLWIVSSFSPVQGQLEIWTRCFGRSLHEPRRVFGLQSSSTGTRVELSSQSGQGKVSLRKNQVVLRENYRCTGGEKKRFSLLLWSYQFCYRKREKESGNKKNKNKNKEGIRDSEERRERKMLVLGKKGKQGSWKFQYSLSRHWRIRRLPGSMGLTVSTPDVSLMQWRYVAFVTRDGVLVPSLTTWIVSSESPSLSMHQFSLLWNSKNNAAFTVFLCTLRSSVHESIL